ncbi:MAG TPA: SRPBCC domain-containing protein, partial [Planctomycetia bacterium]|nr:SRPBCC domain-containing protein [Planctomycetia bacterium]
DWDNQLESMENGWPSFFKVLHSYLANFRGQSCVSFRINGTTTESPEAAWTKLKSALAIAEPPVGSRIVAAGGSPGFAGTVDRVGAPASPHELSVVMDAPAPGLAVFGTYSWGGRTQVALHLYHYGDQASKAAATEAAWQAWMEGVFPKVEEAGANP